MSQVNKYVARAFMPLLLVNCPSNALLTITLLTGSRHLDLMVQFLLLMVLLEQFLCIFLVHSLLASLNDRLKTLAQRYIPLLYERKLTRDNRRQKLLGYLFIEKFHISTKLYGFTYHTFGRISSFNFVKVSLKFSFF